MNDLIKMNPINLNVKEHVREFLDRYDTILCDCDGVLWRNSEAVPDVPRTLVSFRTLKSISNRNLF